MALEKACFRIMADCTVGNIKLKADEKIFVQFNPEKYSISTQVKYSFNQDSGKWFAQYGGAAARTLTVEFFYDMLSEKGVFSKSGSSNAPDGQAEKPIFDNEFPAAKPVNDAYVNKIAAMTKPGKEKSAPPLVEFIWGNETIRGVIESLTQQYVLFNQKGEPIRAQVQLSLKECEDIAEAGKGSSSSAQPTAGPSAVTAEGLAEEPTEAVVKEALVKAIKLL